jgi:hypothetical protein
MAPRERRLVTALVGSVIAFAVLVTGFIVFGNISDIKQSNEETPRALADIAKHRDEYMEARERMRAQEVRIGPRGPSSPPTWRRRPAR